MQVHRSALPLASPPVRVALVVDDDAFVRGVLARVVGRLAGYAVTEASDGAAALAAAEALVASGRPPAVLVTDVDMPGLDGVALAAAVAARAPGVRVLLVSGRPLPPGAAAALAGVTYRFVAKPFALDDVLSFLAAAA